MDVTVLLIDADRFVRELLPRYLRREGLTSLAYADGAAGLRAIADHHPAVVLLDLGLPDIDGWAMLRQLRGHAAYQPAVMLLAGCGDYPDRMLSREFGVSDYIVKSFAAADVVARVHAVLAHKRSSTS